ncbi:MAG: tRNA (cytidine(34)-2'-O)-methyltransferase [Mycoplasmatales bacterium]|nr:tRNA (cytidine(34)-2'-O)-methyltransferase [Mycoplasmatales bacterium]
MINIILYQPEIPNNTGNIIRTTLATGSKLHIIKPISFDLHPKWLKRAAAGRLLSDIPHEIHSSYNDFLKLYGDKKIYYITRYAQNTYSDAPFKEDIENDGEIWLMFGRESTGIPKEIMKKSLETTLRIPMIAEERSLNLSTTVMLLVYEAHRQNGYKGLSKFEVQKGKNFINE